MAKFLRPVPIAELGSPPRGFVFASRYQDALDLLGDVASGNMKILDTRNLESGEGMLENLDVNPYDENVGEN